MRWRNFELVADLDGRERPLRAETRGEFGGFDLDIRVADDHTTVTLLSITGRAYRDNRLILRAYQGHALVWRAEVRR
jgi:hypothetical protein